MAITASEIETSYPIPSYRYTVDLGGEAYRFQSVDFGDIGFQSISYWDNSGPKFMPGRRVDEISVTFARGIVPESSELYDWLKDANFNKIDKRDLTVSLTDDDGQNALVTWKITDVFPTTLSFGNFDGSSNDIMIETLNCIADWYTVDFG